MSPLLYIGFDFSTQQVKAIVIDDQSVVVHEETVKFDEELPEFKTAGGVHVHSDEVTVTAPTLMWVKALDLLLVKLKNSKRVNFEAVVAISGAGQQHGSVYWSCGAEEKLKNLVPSSSLFEQLRDKEVFSIQNSPIWMDSSTTEECKQMESTVGGKQILLLSTGSRAYERFTGPQIAKIYKWQQDAYSQTETISLVSSFGASLFLGKFAPIDWSDASGMNLFDIKKKDWNDACLDACAPGLRQKLGNPVPSHSVVGSISSYFCDRYGFSPECKVVAFTGDNPASLAGLQLAPHEIIVSLGTSDTLFLWLSQPAAFDDGHVFINPVDSNAYMGLLCYKNGSFMREAIRDEKAGCNWATFEEILVNTKPGNEGYIGMYFDKAEITPSNVTGRYYFDRNDAPLKSLSREAEIRALIEGQFLAKRVHAENMGFDVAKCKRVLATGGASVNAKILQILADTFGIPVFTLEVGNSAALGSAFRAKHGLIYHATGVPFSQVIHRSEFSCAATPDPSVKQVYNEMAARYRNLEETFLRK